MFGLHVSSHVASLQYLHNQALGKDNAENEGEEQGAGGLDFPALLLSPYAPLKAVHKLTFFFLSV